MSLIVLDNGDGTVGILVPASEAMAQGWTLEQIIAKDGGKRPYKVVDESDIPANRVFRKAWAPGAGGVMVDMPRARVVQMDLIRGRRDERLRELDIEQLRGQDVVQRKQALRDLPANVDLESAQTPEELEAVWPAELEA